LNAQSSVGLYLNAVSYIFLCSFPPKAASIIPRLNAPTHKVLRLRYGLLPHRRGLPYHLSLHRSRPLRGDT
jgi:hypothetical protein